MAGIEAKKSDLGLQINNLIATKKSAIRNRMANIYEF
jgi:hypothetical protein